MASLTDPDVRALFDEPNYAVISTLDADGQVNSAVIWLDVEDGAVAVNSAVGRRWPTNLERDPRVTVLVTKSDNPYWYVEVRGRATPRSEGADAHIDRLTKKYLGRDEYPFRQPGEQRITYLIEPQTVRLVKQG